MAVDFHKETHNSRSGQISEQYERRYTRTFRVHCDSALDGQLVVLADTRTPRLYSLYVGAGGEYDTGAFCVEVKATQDPEDPQTWDVTAEYSNVSRVSGRQGTLPSVGHGSFGTNTAGATGASPDNPLIRPSEISWGFTTRQLPLVWDIDGNLICNSAGDPFDPPAEYTWYDLVVRITRNEAHFNPIVALDYIGTVNKTPFLGCGQEQCLMTVFDGQRAFESGFLFWKVRYEIQVRDRVFGWRLDLLDQGFRQRVAGVMKPILDADLAQPVKKPALLDGAGAVLAVGAASHTRSFHVYPQMDFNALNLM